MAIDYLARRNTAEKGVTDYLASRENGITEDLLKTAATVRTSRDRFKSNLGGLAEQTAGKYGMENLNPALDAQVQRQEQDLDRTNKESLALRKVQERKERVNKVYGMMVDRLANAGIDRQQAEAVATQFALDEDARAFQSEESGKDREATLKKQDIMDEYANRRGQMERQAADDQRRQANRTAIIRSLFGISSTIATGYALRGMGGSSSGSGSGVGSGRGSGSNIQTEYGGSRNA